MVLILVAAAAGGWLFNAAMPQGIEMMPRYAAHPLWREATPEQAYQLWRGKALIVDARDPGEYKAGHVRGAVNLYPHDWDLFYPLLEPQLRQAPAIVVYGSSVSRFPAARVGQELRRKGLEEVWVTTAGLEELELAGLPLRKPKPRGGGS